VKFVSPGNRFLGHPLIGAGSQRGDNPDTSVGAPRLAVARPVKQGAMLIGHIFDGLPDDPE
jgi:hypothetical protein